MRTEEKIIIDLLLDVRKIISEELPVDESIITYDLILLVLAGHFNDKHVQMKSVVCMLPHSKTGVRYSCKRLVEDGWIEKAANGSDARVRLLVPTDKLLNCCSSFVDRVLELSSTLSDRKS